MNELEFSLQSHRIVQYNALTKRRNILYGLIKNIKGVDSNWSPFSSSFTEIRQLESLTVNFSSTKGGKDPAEMYLSELNIPAYELGNFLTVQLNKEIETINEQLEKL